MSDKFQLLLQQIGMPLDARQSGAFSTATIEKVVLHKVSKLWEFTFRFETPCRHGLSTLQGSFGDGV